MLHIRSLFVSVGIWALAFFFFSWIFKCSDFTTLFSNPNEAWSSDLAQWRPASLRWESCWNLPNDSERSAACASIQHDKRRRGGRLPRSRGTAQPVRSGALLWVWSYQYHILWMNESLALVSPETKDALHLEWWNEIDISMQMEHPQKLRFSSQTCFSSLAA